MQFLREFRLLNVDLPRKVIKMAKSKFEYVRQFESEDSLLPNSWIVVRVDGKGFHKFSSKHEFAKPNDQRALDLMNKAASKVMQEYKDIVLSYGESDEYSFMFRKETEVYNRRRSKLSSYVCSLFTSSYVFYWSDYFGEIKLRYPPCFDARVVLYPSDKNLCDYLCWRQVDTHINNLYNTTFWNLILKGGLSNKDAEERLSGSVSSDKNEILFKEFDINYNNEPIMYRKGTILLRKKVLWLEKFRQVIYPIYEDMTNDKFWDSHLEVLNNLAAPKYECGNGRLPELVVEQLKHIKSSNVDG